jgi:diguanylate cyclase
MEPITQPNDIAREAIKRLATRKQPPTPENFRRAYLEVQGAASVQSNWPESIRTLLAQWESYQAGLTQAKKRDMLDRVLINFGNDPDQLAVKLTGLARSWGESGSASAAVEGAGMETPAPDVAAAAQAVPASTALPSSPIVGSGGDSSTVGRLIVRYLEEFSSGCRSQWPDLATQGDSLVRKISNSGHLLEEKDVETMVGLWREIVIRADDEHELLFSLRRLLTLLFKNISELVSEDAWLSGQMVTMQAALSDHLNPHALFQAEEGLKELVQKQKQIKGSMNEAKEKLKRLVSSFINRIGEMSESTGQYNARIKDYSVRISKAEDIAELSDVMDGLSSDMAQMENQMVSTHQELLTARTHAEEAEMRIHTLEKELEEVSSLVREDQLTGALNRRGMEEAFAKELARADRMTAPFSVALLDIDHFKRLNDALGHQAGDQALVHLTSVVRQLLRPTDSFARYGGEEFLVLLPNSDLADAERIMLRVQRELTKQFFLHDNQRVLITFSAGVAQLQSGEAQADLLKRADTAMYKAKAAGRNRVERA